jgi:predicted small lipoprotein YifL
MPTLIKSVLALTLVLSLAACASGPGGCPDGTHWGAFHQHCVPNR